MHTSDVEDFTAILRGLGTAFSKPITDDLRSVYWEALKDQPIGVIRARAEEHTRRGKFFPKPQELRARDDPRPMPIERSFVEAERLCVQHLEQLRAERGEDWFRRYVWLCRLDRIIATDHPSSPIYLEAVREARILRPLVRGY